jgi:hypothetical protein
MANIGNNMIGTFTQNSTRYNATFEPKLPRFNASFLTKQVPTKYAPMGLKTIENVNLENGRNVIVHNLGKRPREVSFYFDNQNQNFAWSRADGEVDCDILNKLIVFSDDDFEGVEINIIY